MKNRNIWITLKARCTQASNGLDFLVMKEASLCIPAPVKCLSISNQKGSGNFIIQDPFQSWEGEASGVKVITEGLSSGLGCAAQHCRQTFLMLLEILGPQNWVHALLCVQQCSSKVIILLRIWSLSCSWTSLWLWPPFQSSVRPLWCLYYRAYHPSLCSFPPDRQCCWVYNYLLGIFLERLSMMVSELGEHRPAPSTQVSSPYSPLDPNFKMQWQEWVSLYPPLSAHITPLDEVGMVVNFHSICSALSGGTKERKVQGEQDAYQRRFHQFCTGLSSSRRGKGHRKWWDIASSPPGCVGRRYTSKY